MVLLYIDTVLWLAGLPAIVILFVLVMFILLKLTGGAPK